MFDEKCMKIKSPLRIIGFFLNGSMSAQASHTDRWQKNLIV
jgi:hypothetical protein